MEVRNMGICRRYDKCSLCGLLGIVISLALGALFAVLVAFNLLSNIVVVPFITLVLSTLLLLALLSGLVVAAVSCRCTLARCLHKYTPCLLAGIVGTLVASVVKLAIGLLPLIASVIALFALSVFFVYMLLGIIEFVTCISKKL
jgi:hypothetical protein